MQQKPRKSHCNSHIVFINCNKHKGCASCEVHPLFIDKFTGKLFHDNFISVEYIDTFLCRFAVEACTVDVVPNVVCSSFVGYFAYLGLLNIASECPKHYV